MISVMLGLNFDQAKTNSAMMTHLPRLSVKVTRNQQLKWAIMANWDNGNMFGPTPDFKIHNILFNPRNKITKNITILLISIFLHRKKLDRLILLNISQYLMQNLFRREHRWNSGLWSWESDVVVDCELDTHERGRRTEEATSSSSSSCFLPCLASAVACVWRWRWRWRPQRPCGPVRSASVLVFGAKFLWRGCSCDQFAHQLPKLRSGWRLRRRISISGRRRWGQRGRWWGGCTPSFWTWWRRACCW